MLRHWTLDREGYARRKVRLPDGRWSTSMMHRELLGLRIGDPRECDHINGDRLDNRRQPLPPAAHALLGGRPHRERRMSTVVRTLDEVALVLGQNKTEAIATIG